MLRPGGALPAFFTGLLPEGRRLGALRRAVKTSVADELSLLLAVGADTVGDVQVLPVGAEPTPPAPHVELDPHQPLRFADLLVELDLRPDRTGLPGVQDKASAARAVLIRDASGAPGLAVTRFERVAGDSGVRPLAVEDGCQVQGRAPGDKYAVGYAATFAALSAVCDARLLAVRTLLEQLVFAILTGNGDAHANNFSVLQQPDGEWRVSPAYDVPSSQPYGDTTLAMSVNSRTSEPAMSRPWPPGSVFPLR